MHTPRRWSERRVDYAQLRRDGKLTRSSRRRRGRCDALAAIEDFAVSRRGRRDTVRRSGHLAGASSGRFDAHLDDDAAVTRG